MHRLLCVHCAGHLLPLYYTAPGGVLPSCCKPFVSCSQHDMSRQLLACDLIAPCVCGTAGRVGHKEVAYSGNVRQQLHTMYNSSEHPDGPIIMWEGVTNNYSQWQQSAKFCLAPYGFGWGIRLSIVMATGCVPVIIQVCRWHAGCMGWEVPLISTCNWSSDM